MADGFVICMLFIATVIIGLAIHEWFADKAVDNDPDVYLENFWKSEDDNRSDSE